MVVLLLSLMVGHREAQLICKKRRQSFLLRPLGYNGLAAVNLQVGVRKVICVRVLLASMHIQFTYIRIT